MKRNMRKRFKRLYKKGTSARGVGLKGVIATLPDGRTSTSSMALHPTSQPRFNIIDEINKDMKGK